MNTSKLQNYRAIFLRELDDKIDYWNNFKEIRHQYPLVRCITNYAKKELGIEYIWFFYEPFIEITWMTKNPAKSKLLFEFIREQCHSNNITDLEEHGPESGNYADWYCNDERECEFGAKRHDICRQWVDLYFDYAIAVDQGKGLEKQLARTIHTLCNPLGLNFTDEGKLCFFRFLQCYLFRFFHRKLAIFIYTKVFRQKYD